MELDATQFAELIDALGKGPKVNWFAAANIMAVMSVIISFLVAFLAYIEWKGSRRAKYAEFVLQSNKDYRDIFDCLAAVGDWEKDDSNRNMLAKIDIHTVQPNNVDILEAVEIPEDIWKNARTIKTHFKVIANMHSHRVVSREAIEISLDHWGYRLLMTTVRKLDVHRFYFARREEKDRINNDEFENDFKWYRDLASLKEV